jgi:DASS family divalent anion:Na+ symporter
MKCSASDPPSRSAPAVPASPPAVRVRDVAGWTALLVVPPAVYAAGTAADFSVEAAIFGAILAAAVLLWVFSLVDEFIPPIVVIVATLFINLAPPEVALAGFASPAFVTLLGVFALAAAIGGSGLARRVMLLLLAHLPDRPFFHQLVLLAGGYLLSPITPSGNNRLSLLLPLYREMVTGLRLPPRSGAATALMTAAYSGAMLMSPMLPTSKSSNIAAVALLPPQVQQEFLGLFWLVAAAVAALGLTLWHVVVSARMFADVEEPESSRPELAAEVRRLGPLSGAEWIAAGGFVFFLGGAVSVPWHHVPAAWIAGCVLVVLLVSGVLGREEFRQRIDWAMIVFLLGVDGIVRIIDYLGLDAVLARIAADAYGFVGPSIERFILAALATTLLVRLALPVTAGMLVSVVILLPVAAAGDIHPWICVFLTAMFSDIFFFPYQSSVYLQAVSQGLGDTFDERRFMTYNRQMNLARVAVAFLSIPWWRWLGLL